MDDFLLNPETNDLIIQNGNLVWASNIELKSQQVSTRLKTFLGEWFADHAIGLPYFQYIFQNKAEIEVISQLIKREIAEVKGIKLLAFQIGTGDEKLDAENRLNRHLVIKYTIKVDKEIIEKELSL